MKLIPIEGIVVQPRQRTSIPDKHIEDLKRSILDVGLLHPPVCWFNDQTDKWELVAGECRLTAIRSIAAESLTFRCGDSLVPAGSVPITGVLEALSSAEERFAAELDENLRREKLDWKDEAQALAKLHSMRRQENPKQTLLDTGTEVAQLKGTQPRHESQKVRDAQIVAKAIESGNTAIINARNQTEAMAMIYRQEEDRLNVIIARRRMATLKGPLDVTVRHGDLAIVLPSLDAEQYDLIFADPPYGIGADTAGFRSRTVHHHNYEDNIEGAKAIAECILVEGFRIAKKRANLLMFHDIKLWDFLQRTAKQMGWAVFPRPLIWRKSESEGMAPWGGQGPRLTTETILYATKGQRGMTASPTDVFTYPRVPRKERVHAAEKPIELLKKLIEITTLPGDAILDPCCGSGSTLLAAREAKRTGLGIEKDRNYFELAFANLHSSIDEASEKLAALQPTG